MRTSAEDMNRYCRYSVFLDDQRFESIGTRLKKPGAKPALLHELWKTLFDAGGAMLHAQETLYGTRIPHLTYLLAARQSGGERVFLLCDPEIRGFKLLSEDDMATYATLPQLELEVVF